METMTNLIAPISNMSFVLFVVYWIFAIIGMRFFGGKVKKDLPYPIQEGTNSVPATYHLDNFNDFVSSMVTLFTLMVVNNWMVQVSQFVYVTRDEYNENLVRFYFILFYYFSVVIGINLVVAYVLDMYDSIERLNSERLQTLIDMEKKIEEMQGDDDISEVYQDKSTHKKPLLVTRRMSYFVEQDGMKFN